MVGNSMVGKTSIVNRYVNNKFTDQYLHSPSIQYLQKVAKVGKTD
jgi:GTPase SAR1 family protein